MKTLPNTSRTQRGAALVVGLILLMVLTVLAITGMNMASTELIMAGNEQYRQRATQAAETGVEEAMSNLSTLAQNPAPVVVAATAVPDSDPDTYATSSQYMGEDGDIPGFSAGKFVGFHYAIQSTGQSARNATVVHNQGAYVVGSTGGNTEDMSPL